MLNEALIASNILHKSGIQIKVINMPWLNSNRHDWLLDNITDCDDIFIIDDHHVVGGLGDNIISNLNNLSKSRFTKYGINSVPNCGSPIEVLQSHSLDGKSLAKSIAKQIDVLLDDDYVNNQEDYQDNAPQ